MVELPAFRAVKVAGLLKLAEKNPGSHSQVPPSGLGSQVMLSPRFMEKLACNPVISSQWAEYSLSPREPLGMVTSMARPEMRVPDQPIKAWPLFFG